MRKLRRHWRGGIPNYVPAALREQKRKLDHLYSKVKLDSTTEHYFEDSDGTILTRWLVYCHDLETLMHSRELLDGETCDDFHDPVGIDDGKDLLKLTYNKVRKGEVPMKIKRGKEKPVNDDRGVKHCQVIAAVAGVKETYHNVKTLFAMLKLDEYPKCKLVADLKAANIMLGIQTARAKYPCLYGHCFQTSRTRTAVWVKGEDRTLENLILNQENWLAETGGDRTKLKEYFNVEFPPLIASKTDSGSPTLVLQCVPIPLLHTLLLNPCNHILKHLGEVWPQLKEWLKRLGVVMESYHGDKFEGIVISKK